MENQTKKSSIFMGYPVTLGAILTALAAGGGCTLSYYMNGVMVNEGLIDSTVSGTCTSIVSFCSVLLSAIAGTMLQKLGHKKAMMLGFIPPIIAFALLFFLPAAGYLNIFAAFCYGACLVMISKVGTPSLIRTWFSERASLPTALVIAAASFASIFSGIIAKMIGANGWRAGWVFQLCLVGCGLLVTLLLIRDDIDKFGEVPDSIEWRKKHDLPLTVGAKEKKAETGSNPADKEAIKDKKFWIFSICSLLRMGVYAGASAYITQIILSRGFTKEEAAIALASLTLSSTVGRLSTPVLNIVKITNSMCNVLAHFIMTTGCLILVTATTIKGFSLAVICMGFAYGLGFVGQTLVLGDLFPKATFSSLLGKFNTVINLSFVFPMIVGFVGKALGENYSPIYLVFGIINLIAGVILFFFRVKKTATADAA